jgi:hypothetical protein
VDRASAKLSLDFVAAQKRSLFVAVFATGKTEPKV